MSRSYKTTHIILTVVLATFVLMSQTLGTLASDDILVGPQGHIGPSNTVGPNGQVGTNGETGPQGTLGPQQNTSEASSTTQTNTDTGPDSTNINTSTDSNNTTASNTNTATIDNNVNLTATTGNTNLNNNTSVGHLSTGNVQGSVTVINAGNSNLSVGSSIGTQNVATNGSNQVTLQQSQNRTIIASNDSTGPGSTNQNVTNGNNVVQVNTNNNATANTTFTVNATTGNINANSNTSLAGITTGGVNLGLTTINALNITTPVQLNVDVYNLPPGFNGDIIVPQLANVQTGTGSENTNDISINRTTRASIINNASIANSTDLQTNTGGVVLGQNTTAGNVVTGDTRITGSTVNVVGSDTPVFYLVNVYGTWNGTIAGIDPKYIIVQDMNNTTGPGSTNTNTTALNTDTELNVINNANATNTYRINADTGHINANNNTELGSISTGGINLSLNTFNILNTASAGLKNIALGIINIFGNFSGHIASEAPQASENQNTNSTATQTTAQVTQDANGVHVVLPSQDGINTATVDITQTPSGTSSVGSAPTITPSNPLKTMSMVSKAYTPVIRYITQYITYYEPQTIEWDEQVPILANALEAKALEANAAKQIPHSFWYTLVSGLSLVGLWGLSEYLAIRNKR